MNNGFNRRYDLLPAGNGGTPPAELLYHAKPRRINVLVFLPPSAANRKPGVSALMSCNSRTLRCSSAAAEKVVTDTGTDCALSSLRRAVTTMRSEERRVGKECVSTCSSRGSPYH